MSELINKQTSPGLSTLWQKRKDSDLLRLYAEKRSEEAFGELARRYAGLVYSTCLREIGERTLAEDAAQGVFLLLSQKAGNLRHYPTLAGWLYTSARLVSKNLRKQEQRRQMNETRALQEASVSSGNSSPLWEQIEPHLHEALSKLKPIDREAVLLRYLNEQSLLEVGNSLGVSENTARMRINRALEKIRTHLAKMGVAVTVAALASLLEAHPAQAASPALQARLRDIPAGTVAGSSPATTLSNVVRQTAMQMLLTGFFRKVILPLLGIVVLCGGVGYRMLVPQRVSLPEQHRLFTALAGSWKGSMEYADDRTRQRNGYPTQVTVRSLANGDTLELSATFTGASNVDVTTFTTNPGTGEMSVTNGGPQSSHRLNAVGRLVHLPDGEIAFQGRDGAKDVRIRLSLKGNQFSFQEEYRNDGTRDYLFRNGFTLQK